jgi:hypothetical protein
VTSWLKHEDRTLWIERDGQRLHAVREARETCLTRGKRSASGSSAWPLTSPSGAVALVLHHLGVMVRNKQTSRRWSRRRENKLECRVERESGHETAHRCCGRAPLVDRLRWVCQLPLPCAHQHLCMVACVRDHPLSTANMDAPRTPICLHLALNGQHLPLRPELASSSAIPDPVAQQQQQLIAPASAHGLLRLDPVAWKRVRQSIASNSK